MDKSRFPVITVIILLLNVIFYGVAFLMGSPNRVEIERIAGELTNYCMDHPYLDLPQETFQKLPPDSQSGIALMKSKRSKVADMLDAVNKKRMLDEQILNLDSQAEPTQEELESQQALLEKARKAEQQQLDVMVQEFEQALAVTFYTEYGYVAQKGTLRTMLTSMFLHDSIGLLFLNMLILGIVGWKFEQTWGHVIFPIVYLVGGIAATLFYGIIMSTRIELLLGPAGAITAVIGMLALHLVFKRDPANAILLPILGVCLLVLFITQSHVVWSPVGGLIFGFIAGGVVKFSGLETRLLAAPAPAQAPVDVDRLVSAGIQKFQDQDIEGAIQDFQRAAKERPTDPAIHSELCRAYLQNDNKKSALRQFKRTVQLYFKQNGPEKAVDEYLDITAADPEMAADPPQQKKIAEALEKRATADDSLDLFARAALAYKHLIAHYQHVIKNLESPEAVNALIRYGDINLSRLKRPQAAYEAYRAALQSSALSPQQQQVVKAKARQAVQLLAPHQSPPSKVKPQEKPQQTQTASPTHHPKPKIPLQKRIKLIQETGAPAKYQVSSVAPLETNQVLPVSGGMDFQRPSERPLAFQRIYAICVAQLPNTVPGQIVADLFPGGQSRPYRVESNNVAYTQFFQKDFSTTVENFRQFILHIISQIDSVYIDQGTLDFLKTGKPQIFSSQDELAMHEKMFWQQLMGAVRFQCEQCWQVYWIDEHKIPEGGAKTKCNKCGNPLFVQRPTKSA